MYLTGIALSQEADDDCFIAAATWHRVLPRNFSLRRITLPYAKENLLSLVVIRSQSVTEGINAACHRTAEQLLISQQFCLSTEPQVTLIVKPKLSRLTFCRPHIKKKNHWLLSTADTVLFDWLRGVR